MTAPLLQVKDVSVSFRVGSGRRRHVLDAVQHADITLERGEILGLVGESGSGKSTISRVICGLQRDYRGHVLLDGRELLPRRNSAEWRAVQMVFQDPFASLDPRMSVGRMLTELIRHHHVASRADERAVAERALELVQLPTDYLGRLPAAMSGGQRQRVAIARALILEPRVLVADEAVSALDVSVQAGIVDLLARLRDELGLAVLFVAHDLAVVHELCDRVAVIHHGVLVEQGDIDTVFATPEDAYTRQLLDAVPRFSSAFLD